MSNPLYFITVCTRERARLLDNDSVHRAFREFCETSHRNQGVAVGRYVILPDHVHFFLRLPESVRLGSWMGRLKQHLTLAVNSGQSLWQRGFFDHVLRSDESYAEKWHYVVLNPVRIGLVGRPEDWPYAGELLVIDRS